MLLKQTKNTNVPAREFPHLLYRFDQDGKCKPISLKEVLERGIQGGPYYIQLFDERGNRFYYEDSYGNYFREEYSENNHQIDLQTNHGMDESYCATEEQREEVRERRRNGIPNSVENLLNKRSTPNGWVYLNKKQHQQTPELIVIDKKKTEELTDLKIVKMIKDKFGVDVKLWAESEFK